jgi:methionyl-tRNA formyltransferase
MRLVYLGTPDAAVPPLRALVDAGHDIAFVVTQPDKRRSRGGRADPSPVKDAASQLGLDVRTPDKAREIVDAVAASGAEVGVVVAFGQLLPTALLEALPLGFVNVHFSLLPRWRGAAPVERALLAGDAESGVCVMQIEAGLDTGPVFDCARVAITPAMTAGALRDVLVREGTRLLLEQLPGLARAVPTPQSGTTTYAEKLDVDEFRLDPALPMVTLDRLVRAGDPQPGAWFRGGGQRFKVFGPVLPDGRETPLPAGTVSDAGIGTAEGTLQLREIQPPGKRRMSWADWRRGHPDDLVIERSESGGRDRRGAEARSDP